MLIAVFITEMDILHKYVLLLFIIVTNMELKEASLKERFFDFSELALLRHYSKKTYYECYLLVPHLKQVLINNCSQRS